MWQLAGLETLKFVSKYNNNNAQERIAQAQYKVDAKMAELEGAVYGMQLQQNFNTAMANDVVMAAAQNRRGGSVTAIANAAEKQFNWDQDFAKLSTSIKISGIQRNAEISKMNTESRNAEALFDAGVGMYSHYGKAQSRKSLLSKEK